MRFQLECLQKSESWSALLLVQQQIAQNGFLTFLAGGAVRDAFLGLQPHDFDLVTDASLDDLKKIFKKVILVGESFGVIRVLQDDKVIEVAQFRKESDYADGRRPSLVSAATPKEDAHRRDFTVNALFYDFSIDQVLDFVDGVRDLQNEILRCVGDARVRFQEDHLRILRAIRFEAQLGFKMEQQTWQACRELAPLTAKVSRERVQEELIRMLIGPRPWQAIQALFNSGVMKVLFPEREASFRSAEEALSNLFHQPVMDADLALLFFMWKIPETADFFKNLKWPKKNEKKIISALEILAAKESFFKLRLGEQLMSYQDELFRKAVLACEGFYFSSEENVLLGHLKEKWNQVNIHGELPASLVRAGDLPEKFAGAKIGEVLREAFLIQLENAKLEKEQVLQLSLVKF